MPEMTYAEYGILQAQNKRIAELESQLAEARKALKNIASMNDHNFTLYDASLIARNTLAGEGE